MRIGWLLVIMLLVPTQALCFYKTGNDIYASCSSPSATREFGLCIGYVAGLADAFLEEKAFCPPTGVTIIQLKDVLVKYLQNNPEKRHMGASEALLAFDQAFPCPK